MKSETKDDRIGRHSFSYIPTEVRIGMALTGSLACSSYGLCNQLSRNMKSKYNRKLPMAVPMFFTATVIVMAGQTAQLQHQHNRVIAVIKAMVEENPSLREIDIEIR